MNPPGQSPMNTRSLREVILSLGGRDPHMPEEAVPWARRYGTDWERALAECEEIWVLGWLVDALLYRGHLKHEALVLAACACARSVLHLVPTSEDRPRLALEVADRWTRGEATLEEVAVAQVASCDASWDAAARIAPSQAAAIDAVGWALVVAARARVTPGHAAKAVCAAVARAVRDRGEAPDDGLARMRREFAPVLLEGLTTYAATLPRDPR